MLLLPFKIAFRILALIIVAAIIYLIVSAVQVVLAGRVSSSTAAPGDAAAIVVIGGPTSGQHDPALLARLDQALALYDGRRAPLVVDIAPMPSASAPGSLSFEGSFFRSHGVPESALRATEGSVAAALGDVSDLLGANKNVILVSDAVNVAVSLHEASAAGLIAIASPPPSSKVAAYSEVAPLWRNASALAAGRIIGYGRASWADWS